MTEKKKTVSAEQTAPVKEKKPAAKRTAKKTETRKPEGTPEKKPTRSRKPVVKQEQAAAPVEAPAAPVEPQLPQPRRSVAFIGSECYPFVKTGGLGDVMYALPKALIQQNCDVKVILP